MQTHVTPAQNASIIIERDGQNRALRARLLKGSAEPAAVLDDLNAIREHQTQLEARSKTEFIGKILGIIVCAALGVFSIHGYYSAMNLDRTPPPVVINSVNVSQIILAPAFAGGLLLLGIAGYWTYPLVQAFIERRGIQQLKARVADQTRELLQIAPCADSSISTISLPHDLVEAALRLDPDQRAVELEQMLRSALTTDKE